MTFSFSIWLTLNGVGLLLLKESLQLVDFNTLLLLMRKRFTSLGVNQTNLGNSMTFSIWILQPSHGSRQWFKGKNLVLEFLLQVASLIQKFTISVGTMEFNG